MSEEESKRRVVIPGEVIVKGDDYLPGEGTEKRNGEIVALRFGLAEDQNKLIRIIPLSGVYQPRRGNVVIGKVENVTFNGWVVNIGASENGFIMVSEVPKYLNKDSLDEFMGINDMVVAKIFSITKRGIDLTLRSKGLGKIDEGILLEINPNKVPRVIGKEGSMISMIKEETGCDVTVGQNGLVWIKGSDVEKELLAKEAINFITDRPFVKGLTDEVKKWFGGKNEHY